MDILGRPSRPGWLHVCCLYGRSICACFFEETDYNRIKSVFKRVFTMTVLFRRSRYCHCGMALAA